MGAQKTNTSQWGENARLWVVISLSEALPFPVYRDDWTEEEERDSKQIDGIVHNLVHVKPVKKILRKGA